MEQNFQHDHLPYEHHKQTSSSNRSSLMDSDDSKLKLPTADFVNRPNNNRDRGRSSSTQPFSSANSAFYHGGTAQEKEEERLETSLGRDQTKESQRLYRC